MSNARAVVIRVTPSLWGISRTPGDPVACRFTRLVGEEAMHRTEGRKIDGPAEKSKWIAAGCALLNPLHSYMLELQRDRSSQSFAPGAPGSPPACLRFEEGRFTHQVLHQGGRPDGASALGITSVDGRTWRAVHVQLEDPAAAKVL